MNLLTVKDVMSRLGVGRVTATRIIKEAGPVKRNKYQTMYISEAKLKAYLGELQ